MLIGEQTSGVSTDYVPDALGSIVAAINQSLTTTYTAAYAPYGTVLASTGTAPNFTWVGNQGYLPGPGRPYAEYSVRARIFSSKNGRWTTADPLWPHEPAYAYVTDPISNYDYTGPATGTCIVITQGKLRLTAQYYSIKKGRWYDFAPSCVVTAWNSSTASPCSLCNYYAPNGSSDDNDFWNCGRTCSGSTYNQVTITQTQNANGSFHYSQECSVSNSSTCPLQTDWWGIVGPIIGAFWAPAAIVEAVPPIIATTNQCSKKAYDTTSPMPYTGNDALSGRSVTAYLWQSVSVQTANYISCQCGVNYGTEIKTINNSLPGQKKVSLC
jgi:hypothetical protein